MRLPSAAQTLLVWALSPAVQAIAFRQDARINTTNITPSFITNRYIVEFANGVDPNTAATALTDAGAIVLSTYDSAVFKGASVLSEVHDVDKLVALPDVNKSWPTRKVHLTAPVAEPQVFGREAAKSSYSIHSMTGVDKLHDQGIYGKGVKVGVVDSGVQYTHPALGGGFGRGHKVAGGYDLVGNDWGYNSSVKSPGPYPMDVQGHGTHVCGIIAGESEGFAGVAPEASLYVYKVMGFSDGTDEDTLMEAFIMAYEDGVDIITCSIGGLDGFDDDPWALLASRIVEQGILVTVANGNDGQWGSFSESSASNGQYVLAVASVEADVLATLSFEATFSGKGKHEHSTSDVPYQSSVFWSDAGLDGWPIVAFNDTPGSANDACYLLHNTKDFTGTIVLASDLNCELSTKSGVLGANGAYNFIIYTDDFPTSMLYNGTGDNSVAFISAESGRSLLKALRSGVNITARFNLPELSDTLKFLPNTLNPGVASFFTSQGPTNSLSMKPDIAAPGGDIFSTWPIDSWATLSGTSMATPYIAGVAALYIGKHGGRRTHGAGFAKDLAMRIIAAGEKIKYDDGNLDGVKYPFNAPVFQVGTGLVNAVKVLGYSTSLSFTKFSLNDTRNFERYHSIDITNSGPTSVTYTFSLQAGAAVNALVPNPSSTAHPLLGYSYETFISPYSAVPSVSFPSGRFTVKPGQTKTANINFKYPSGLDESALPLYGGNVIISGSNGETLAVPYFGLGADFHKDSASVFAYEAGYPKITVGFFKPVSIADEPTWNFNANRFVRTYPQAQILFNLPTTEFRWDIFDASWKEAEWTYPPVIGKRGFVGAAAVYPDAYPLVGIVNTSATETTPYYDVPRTTSGVPTLSWFGGLSNGTQLPPGVYKMRFAALLPFSTNPERSDSWDVYTDQLFNVTALPTED